MDGNLFGERVKVYRVKQGYTQENLARELGVSWVTVSRWERGENEPALPQLRRLAVALGVQPSALLEDAAV